VLNILHCHPAAKSPSQKINTLLFVDVRLSSIRGSHVTQHGDAMQRDIAIGLRRHVTGRQFANCRPATWRQRPVGVIC